MMNRREFVQLSAAALPVLSMPGLAAVKHIPMGLQLSTVTGMARRDLPGALKAVREIGYDEVEMYKVGYDRPPAVLRQMIVDAGLLSPASAHFDYLDLQADATKQMDYARDLGLRYAVCPMLLPATLREQESAYHEAAVKFNEWGKLAAERGMRFAWHNHDYEFQPFGSTTGYDILLKETDPKLVYFEMDCYWITQAGQDPVAMLHRLGPRVRLIHMKDRLAGFPPSFDMSESSSHFTEFGTGGIDWKTVLATAQAMGIEHYFVEQDKLGPDPLPSLRTGYANARRMLP